MTELMDPSSATLTLDRLSPAAAFSVNSESVYIEELIAKAKAFAEASKAPSTRRALRSDWSDFDDWCFAHGLNCLPASPETVALYLADRAATLAPRTLTRRLTSITQAHRAAGFSGMSPASTRQSLVSAVLNGIRRTKGISDDDRLAVLHLLHLNCRHFRADDKVTGMSTRDFPEECFPGLSAIMGAATGNVNWVLLKYIGNLKMLAGCATRDRYNPAAIPLQSFAGRRSLLQPGGKRWA